MGNVELSNITPVIRFGGRHGQWGGEQATLACEHIDCDCGGTIVIEVNKGSLPRWSRDVRTTDIIRECPKRLAARRARKAANTRRWRERHPDEAREKNREAVRRHRAKG